MTRRATRRFLPQIFFMRSLLLPGVTYRDRAEVMAPAFGNAEYDSLVRAGDAGPRSRCDGHRDPANINWLSGYDAWSFYTPQVMLVDLQDGPFWVGR